MPVGDGVDVGEAFVFRGEGGVGAEADHGEDAGDGEGFEGAEEESAEGGPAAGAQEVDLRGRGFDVADSQANFVWLPVGDRTAELAAALESRAVITRPFAGEGIRVTVGTPEEDDVFLTALDDVRAGAGVR